MNAHTTLLVHAGVDSEAEARITLAAQLAIAFDASLIGMVAAEALLPRVGLQMSIIAVAAVLDAEHAEIRARAEAARGCFMKLTAGVVQSTEWRDAVGSPVSALAREASEADLIIIGRQAKPESPSILDAVSPGDLLMEAGRPVLVVPPGIRQLKAQHVILAWKDTREARRAMADALPFLQRANDVLIVELIGEADEYAGAIARLDQVAAYLRRHGVDAHCEARRSRGTNVAEELAQLAQRETADLIVAGGFGHGRAREWLYGGVTRDLLRASPTCCLLSH